jgi:hypothetical protein
VIPSDHTVVAITPRPEKYCSACEKKKPLKKNLEEKGKNKIPLIAETENRNGTS